MGLSSWSVLQKWAAFLHIDLQVFALEKGIHARNEFCSLLGRPRLLSEPVASHEAKHGSNGNTTGEDNKNIEVRQSEPPSSELPQFLWTPVLRRPLRAE